MLGDVPNCCEWLTICSDVLFIKEAESVTVFPAAVLAIIMLFCQGGENQNKEKKTRVLLWDQDDAGMTLLVLLHISIHIVGTVGVPKKHSRKFTTHHKGEFTKGEPLLMQSTVITSCMFIAHHTTAVTHRFLKGAICSGGNTQSCCRLCVGKSIGITEYGCSVTLEFYL